VAGRDQPAADQGRPAFHMFAIADELFTARKRLGAQKALAPIKGLDLKALHQDHKRLAL